MKPLGTCVPIKIRKPIRLLLNGLGSFMASVGPGLSVWILLTSAMTAANAATTVERLPEPGLQPQAIAAADGTLHLIYLTGDPMAADVFYRRQPAGHRQWSAPLRVNSQRGSAVAIGTIRGPQLALGRNDRVHVAWNGSASASPKPPNGGTPMLYARLRDDGNGFSPQTNLMNASHELDGGGSVAADTEGRVFVVWHGSPAGAQGETNRAVFLARSKDDGNTFEPERRVSPPGAGACGCCGLAAAANARGDVFVLFRAAGSMTQRDMTLLVSADHGERFQPSFTHRWSVGTCPMSSASFAGPWAAWETAGRIHFARIREAEANPKFHATGSGQGAKHPRLAINRRHELLAVWTEGTGWRRGGTVAWQLFDANGEPTSDRGQQGGLVAWNYATTFARPNGEFVILY